MTSATSPAGVAAAGDVTPTYVPTTFGPSPDFPSHGPQYQNGYVRYPQNPVKALPAQPPGAGGTLTAFMAAYRQAPTPLDQNDAWQAINQQLNVTVQMNVVGFADYPTKLATLMAGNDLPDIIHLVNGRNAAPNLPQFLQARCVDLTPYLAGDAVKDYPNLAATPTAAWKSTAIFNGRIIANPIARPAIGSGLFKVREIYDSEIGADVVPKNADDFKRILQQLNRPQEDRWATASYQGNAYDLAYYAQMFGAPNNWQRDTNGKLTKDYETDAYKAAVGYVRDLVADGLFHPNSNTYNIVSARIDFVARKFVVHLEGWNPFQDFARQGWQLNPRTTFGAIAPFASDGSKPIYYLGPGFIGATAVTKTTPERVKEILRIFNWLAAPFGSQEDLLINYGIQGEYYSVDDKGNPVPTPKAASSGEVPWRYIATHPPVIYDAYTDYFARTVYEAEQVLIPLGIADPTLQYYSSTDSTKGVQLKQRMVDGVTDIMAGRRPLSDYDQLVKDWVSGGGDQIRSEYLAQMN